MKLNPHFRTSLCPYQSPLVIPQTSNQPPHPIFLIIFRYFGALESGCVLTTPTLNQPAIPSHLIAELSRIASWFPGLCSCFLPAANIQHSATPITMSQCNTHHNVRRLVFALRISTLKSVSNLLEMSFGISKTKYCSPVSLLIVSSPWDEDRHVSSKSVLTADCSAAKIFLLLVLQKVRSGVA